MRRQEKVYDILSLSTYVYENKLCVHLAGMHTLHSNNRQYNKGWHRRKQKQKNTKFFWKKCSFLNHCCKGCCKTDILQKYSVLNSFGNTINWRQYFRWVLTVPRVTLQRVTWPHGNTIHLFHYVYNWKKTCLHYITYVRYTEYSEFGNEKYHDN